MARFGFTGCVSPNSHNNLMKFVPLSPLSRREGNRGSERSDGLPKVTRPHFQICKVQLSTSAGSVAGRIRTLNS